MDICLSCFLPQARRRRSLPTRNQLDFKGAQTVPEGCVFVMGDNRNASSDSRKAEIGMVDERLIVGKVLLRVFPLDSIGIPDGE